MPTKDEILNFLCELKPELESFGIYKVGLFGSYAKGGANIAEMFKFQPIYLMRRRQNAGRRAVNDKTKYR